MKTLYCIGCGKLHDSKIAEDTALCHHCRGATCPESTCRVCGGKCTSVESRERGCCPACYDGIVIEVASRIATETVRKKMGAKREAHSKRTKAGLARARREGKTLGRPRVDPLHLRSAVAMVDEGASYREAAAKWGVGASTIRDHIRARQSGAR